MLALKRRVSNFRRHVCRIQRWLWPRIEQVVDHCLVGLALAGLLMASAAVVIIVFPV